MSRSATEKVALSARKPAGTSKKKLKEWKSFSPSAYTACLGDGVHFSTKTVNSNALPAGVRLAPEAALDLPYVSVRAMGPAKVPVDYVSNTGPVATIFAQALAVAAGRGAELYGTVPAQDEHAIRSTFAAVVASGRELGTTQVSLRLRQIVVQDAEGRDLALTPLNAAGFSVLLRQRCELEEPRRKRGYLGIGGSNPQNVGAHVRAMQRPLVFYAPTENADFKRALAIHHYGIRLRVPHAALRAYHDWQANLLRRHGHAMPSDATLRQFEASWIRGIVALVFSAATTARTTLEQHRKELPGGEMLAANIEAVARGLIVPSRRDADWPELFARHLREALINTRFRHHGGAAVLAVNQRATERWLDIIKDACVEIAL